MTDTIKVRTQWALRGKVLDNEGYQVIACSSGDLNRANFTDAVSRFELGAIDTLPQVSVSFLQPANRVPGGGYLALAIHWSARNGKRYAEGIGRVDNQGRPTTFTNYFCAPYAALAPHHITYLDMYQAFGDVTLTAKDGPVKDVPFTPSALRVPDIDALAMRVAPLLLTGAPVCVLDADATSLDDRLRFIDTVMGLLPYGLRARMTAATWTRATNRNHRFRLFFSSEPRAGEKQDEVVHWGAPENVRIPSKDARAYFGWLNDKIRPLASLTQLNGEMGFGESADSRILDLVLRFWRSAQEPMAPASLATQDAARVRPVAQRADPVTKVLVECAEHVRTHSRNLVSQDITQLRNQWQPDQIDDKHRERYQKVITQSGLLNPGPGLPRNLEIALYETLLALAFGQPVTYAVLCQVEDCLDTSPGQSFHRSLLEAINQIGPGDLRTRVIVASNLDQRKLAKSLGSPGADGHALLRELARGSWHRQQHGRTFCDVTLDYLQEKRRQYSVTEMQHVLLRHGYLAQPVRDVGGEQYQVNVITRLLDAAFPVDKYPSGLTAVIADEILAEAPWAPTPALLAAVLRRLPDAEAPRVWSSFVYGSVTRMNLDDATRDELQRRLPFTEPPPSLSIETQAIETQEFEIQPEPTREPQQERGPGPAGEPRAEQGAETRRVPWWPPGRGPWSAMTEPDPPDWANSAKPLDWDDE